MLTLRMPMRWVGCQADDRNHIPRVVLAAARLVAGDVDAARTAMKDALRITPDVTDREILRLTGPKIGKALSREIAALRG